MVEFEGTTSVSLDSKGRLVVPSRYRDLLALISDRVVITADPVGCLMLYPQTEWAPIRARLRGLSDMNPRTRDMKLLMLGMAQESTFDTAGRVLLTPDQREFAGLEKGAKLVGLGNRIEIWDSGAWIARIARARELAQDEPPAELEGFML